MKIKVWTVAADDDLGTRATVHITEKEAYQQWFSLQSQGQKPDVLAVGANHIARGDYDALWEWVEEADLSDAFNTYAVEEHEIDLQTGANA